MLKIDTAEDALDDPTTFDNTAATSIYSLGSMPTSTLSLLSSVYMLHGNSMGDEIWSINQNAGIVLEQQLEQMSK